MYFCPKCSYILDITKVEGSKKESKKSLSNISNIIKMILADDNLDEYNFNVDVNSLETNSKYKKLSENDRIKVYNKITENLYVNDASLLCTAPSVNPQGSVMAIAYRNAMNFVQNQ